MQKILSFFVLSLVSFISFRSARIIIKKRQLWCLDGAGTRLHTSSDCCRKRTKLPDLLCVPTVKHRVVGPRLERVGIGKEQNYAICYC
jgi:hypothetical protein